MMVTRVEVNEDMRVVIVVVIVVIVVVVVVVSCKSVK